MTKFWWKTNQVFSRRSSRKIKESTCKKSEICKQLYRLSRRIGWLRRITMKVLAMKTWASWRGSTRAPCSRIMRIGLRRRRSMRVLLRNCRMSWEVWLKKWLYKVKPKRRWSKPMKGRLRSCRRVKRGHWLNSKSTSPANKPWIYKTWVHWRSRERVWSRKYRRGRKSIKI